MRKRACKCKDCRVQNQNDFWAIVLNPENGEWPFVSDEDWAYHEAILEMDAGVRERIAAYTMDSEADSETT